MKIQKYLHKKNTNNQLASMLKSYSLLAAGLVACEMQVEGAIEYTDIDPDAQISMVGQKFCLDFDGDLNPEFIMSISYTSSSFAFGYSSNLIVYGVNPGDEIGFVDSGTLQPAPISDDVSIDSSLQFIFGSATHRLASKGYSDFGGNFVFGPWVGASYKYLGLRFIKNGQTHYGWARLSILPPGIVVGHDYAWETTPNTPIVTGDSGPCDLPANVGVGNIDITSVQYNWDPVPGAHSYQLRGRQSNGSTNYEIFPISDSLQSNFIATNLKPGTSYEASIRTICSSGSDTSLWSAPIIFKTYKCLPVDSVFVSNLTANSVKLNWIDLGPLTPDRYWIVGRPLGSSDISFFKKTYPSTSITLNNLQPNVAFEWVVFTECKSGVYSRSSRTDTFTTLPNLQKNQPTNNLGSIQNEMTIAPHPIKGNSKIQFSNDDGLPYQMTLTDMNGKVVRMINHICGNALTLEKGNLAPGMYILELKGAGYFVQKVLVE